MILTELISQRNFGKVFTIFLRRASTWGDVGAGALAGDHHVGGVGRVEALTGAEMEFSVSQTSTEL